MRHRHKPKAEVFQWVKGREAEPIERVRHAAACKLCIWEVHRAGGGSQYVTIGGAMKLRFANHENTSAQYGKPDFNFVSRNPTEQDVQEIVGRIQYARLCMKTAFAMHVGLTVPRLKKLLPRECYEGVCENQAYPLTITDYVVVATALETLEAAGISDRIPIFQPKYSEEDYNGF